MNAEEYKIEIIKYVNSIDDIFTLKAIKHYIESALGR
jgi:hypothetical protein